MAVVHAHAEDILPFGIASGTPLRPVIHSGSFIGSNVPVWDIADKFGDTNLLVANVAQGQDLAKCMGAANVALMRGHGFAAAARSLIEVVRMSVYPAAQRARADAGETARRRDQISPPGRDRRAQPRLRPVFGRDLARLGILGEQGGRERARHAPRRGEARGQEAAKQPAKKPRRKPKQSVDGKT